MRNCLLLFVLVLAPLASFSIRPGYLTHDTIRISQTSGDVKIKELQQKTNRKFTRREKMLIKIVHRLEKRKSVGVIDKDGKLSFFAALGILVVFGALQLLLNSSAIDTILPVSLVLMGLLAVASVWLAFRSKKKRGWSFKNVFGLTVGGGILVLGIIAVIELLNSE